MVSNNVWVEATVHPESADNIQTYIGNRSNLHYPEPLGKLHITMAFTNLHAADFVLKFDRLLSLQARMVDALGDLPSLTEEEIAVGGHAILRPEKGDFGVLLLSNQLLWSYHSALARELTKTDELDLTYPGWLPHVTLAAKAGDHTQQEAISRASCAGTIKLDGLWLRAGRMCLPL